MEMLVTHHQMMESKHLKLNLVTMDPSDENFVVLKFSSLHLLSTASVHFVTILFGHNIVVGKVCTCGNLLLLTDTLAWECLQLVQRHHHH